MFHGPRPSPPLRCHRHCPLPPPGLARPTSRARTGHAGHASFIRASGAGPVQEAINVRAQPCCAACFGVHSDSDTTPAAMHVSRVFHGPHPFVDTHAAANSIPHVRLIARATRYSQQREAGCLLVTRPPACRSSFASAVQRGFAIKVAVCESHEGAALPCALWPRSHTAPLQLLERLQVEWLTPLAHRIAAEMLLALRPGLAASPFAKHKSLQADGATRTQGAPERIIVYRRVAKARPVPQ
ncbi:hypothetical protein FA95DRAFT_893666 [Auriscalpium vulgare]|uniref:Uncharacterized protein n=1 Tax=Auriscalpium vulgare TaxID=40419 RepID=A0ACB8S0H9_9AGAM|nr:hypothetical protein FA95DRAFT_893666 [Auriscalpium vulgare]